MRIEPRSNLGKIILFLLPAIPCGLLFYQLQRQVVFAVTATVTEGKVISVAVERAVTVISGGFERADSIVVHWIPSVVLVVGAPHASESFICEASGTLYVFGKDIGKNEMLVRKELEDLQKKIHVPVYYKTEGRTVTCKLNLAFDKSEVLFFIIFLSLTVWLALLFWRRAKA